MPRPLRPIADGLIYHVINRGNGRQKVFVHEGDYLALLRAMADLKERKPFDLFGYCLMTNHVHLLLRPRPGQSVSRIMQSLLVSHTQRYHRHHGTGGHVWQGRFKSPVIQDGEHLLAVLRYIEANPVRAKMVERAGDYRWSSYAAHGQGQPDELLSPLPEYESLGARPAVRRRRWSAYVQHRPAEDELSAIRRSTETGLPLGDRPWVARLAKRLQLDLTIRPRGRPPKQVKKARQGDK
jgi:putative transposase